MTKRRRRRKKRGFTDRCYVFYTAAWLCIVFAAIILTSVSGYIGVTDMAPISIAVEKATEVMMVFTGFIVWKAKTENISKYGKENTPDETELG